MHSKNYVKEMADEIKYNIYVKLHTLQLLRKHFRIFYWIWLERTQLTVCSFTYAEESGMKM